MSGLVPKTLNKRGLTVAFECFGARLAICSDDCRILDDLMTLLPPQSRSITAANVDATIFVGRDAQTTLYSMRASHGIPKGMLVYRTIEEVASEFHLAVAIFARPYLFVHAGVVASRGTAILLPGRSMNGKSTLVSALLESGAVYYSDEYAVIDSEGRIYPYRKSLSLRSAQAGTSGSKFVQVSTPAERIMPLGAGAIAFLKYKPDSRWHPRFITPAEAVLGLFKNTVAARARAEVALPLLKRVAESAKSVRGLRPDASVAAPAVLELASRRL